eukprot:TRINITY_DN4935_c0_g1_i3.p1 TRINITY_DN4935_c0_g1~~TRINITY_DN4935_c0_g1_i3.p1  ORF type:complete len:240 (+),score=26.57 TRINITY_DN4935_c0_g1_i3:66-722(+)
MTNLGGTHIYNAHLRVRNTFYEIYVDEPKIRRCKSEPAVCFVFDANGTNGVPPTPNSIVNQKDTASIVNLAKSSDTCEVMGPLLPLTEQHGMTTLLKLAPCDTTVMVRDLPCKVGYERMMAELKSVGLDGCYDFIYCPKSTRNRSAFKGYCFINLMSRGAVEIFVIEFANRQFEGIRSEKAVHIDRAEVQGREANVAHLRSARNRVAFKSDPAGLRAK